LHLNSNHPIDLLVIGGGPAGFMAAITAAEKRVPSVILLEASAKTLEKVRISGGGRCNATHACWDPRDLVNNYPRGRLPLLSCFSRFATGDAVAWFAERGLELVQEADGRMFPKSNSSLEVVSCLRNSARFAGVNCFVNSVVKRIEYLKGTGFLVYVLGQQPIKTKRVLLATGGNPTGRKLAASLGHQIVKPVPSIFSLTLEPSSLNSCSGLALDDVDLRLVVGDKSFHQNGRILITHKGLSGPAILKLSAFAARELNIEKYHAKLFINWINSDQNLARVSLKEFRASAGKYRLSNHRPFKKLPKRLWLAILKDAKIDLSLRWAELPSFLEKKLLDALILDSYMINGRVPYGEEFVIAGGVNLEEVNLVRMESLLLPGLFFSGEILDIDGVTGGFNFQHCWTSGWLAGNAIAKSLDYIN